MTGVTVKITGLEALTARLDRLGAAAKGETMLDGLEAGGRVVQAYAQDNARNKLSKHPTGFLTNSILIKREGMRVLIGVWGVVYAAIHEFGGVITPIRAKALHFVIDGKHILTQRVVIPARPYLRPAVDEHKEAVGAAIAGLLERVARG
jgi:phage gpG-like protein